MPLKMSSLNEAAAPGASDALVEPDVKPVITWTSVPPEKQYAFADIGPVIRAVPVFTTDPTTCGSFPLVAGT